jgi:hypothetical protein
VGSPLDMASTEAGNVITQSESTSKTTGIKRRDSKRTILRTLGSICLLVAGFFAAGVENEATTGKVQTFTFVPMLTFAALAGLFMLYDRRRNPKKELEVRTALQKKFLPIEMGPEAILFLFFVFVVFQSLFLQIPYGIIVFVMSIAGVLIGTWKTYDSFGLNVNASILIFIASLMAVPFTILSLRNPDSLAVVFPAQLTVSLSRSIAFMLALGNQLLVVGGTFLLLGNLSRSSILAKNKISARNFANLNEMLATVIASNPSLSNLTEAFVDIPEVVTLFERAEFKTLFGWGWSVIDRALVSFPVSRYDAAMALGLGSNYSTLKKVRNDTVHEGYVPTLTNAKEMLLLIRETVLAITRIDAAWFAALGHQPKKTQVEIQ